MKNTIQKKQSPKESNRTPGDKKMKGKTIFEFNKQSDIESKVAQIVFDKVKLRQIISDQKEFLSRHRKVSLFRQGHQKGRKISETTQRSLIKGALRSEQAFKNSVKSSLEIYYKNKAQFKIAHEQALADFENFRIFSNPVFFDKKIRATLGETGLTMKELRYYHDIIFINNKNAKAFKKAFANESLDTIFKKATANISKAPFPESNKMLGQMGILTITGGDDVNPMPYIAGAAAIVVGAAATFFGAPQIGIPIMIGGAGLIGTEGWQDVTGTQDGNWGINVNIPCSAQSSNPSVNTNYTPAPNIVSPPPPGYSGRYYGNRSRSKMEVHNVYCPWLNLINREHLYVYNSLPEAHSAGLDNCAHCIGGSLR
jgi:hypothetical protein